MLVWLHHTWYHIHLITCTCIFIFSEKEKLVMSIQKNMNDLAAGLLYLQQDVTIPEISLSIHPIISEAVQKAAQEDRPPTIEDVAGEHLSDSTFVNALQKEVGTWIKEIRKVTYSGLIELLY